MIMPQHALNLNQSSKVLLAAIKSTQSIFEWHAQHNWKIVKFDMQKHVHDEAESLTVCSKWMQQNVKVKFAPLNLFRFTFFYASNQLPSHSMRCDHIRLFPYQTEKPWQKQDSTLFHIADRSVYGDAAIFFYIKKEHEFEKEKTLVSKLTRQPAITGDM